MKTRIAIFTDEDYTWMFPTWVRTIPELTKLYDIVGIYLFQEKLGKMKGVRIPLWYLRVFGLCNFICLGLYSVKIKLFQLASQIKTWRDLASKYNMQLQKEQTPNSETVCDWVRRNNIDIIFITIGNILENSIVNLPNIGIINKHAALLPSCKGLFPFFWAKITGMPTGITFHKVDPGIDSGKILVQMKYPEDHFCGMSMLRFYIDVFYLFSSLAPIAAERLINKSYCSSPVITPSYYGLPTREDFKKYRSKSYKIARLSDLFYQPNLQIEKLKL